MRISGLSGSGLDIDGIVSETMEPYKLKVTNSQKEMKLLELKQTMYQEIIEKGQNFYEKYLNVSNQNSLGNLSTYKSIAFTSSNDNAVSVKGLTGAEKGNYTVSVKQLASSASKTIESEKLVEGQSITISMGDKTETFTLHGSSQSEMVKNLSSELAEKGLSMTAKYSDFANNGSGGLKIATSEIGEDVAFRIKIGDGAEETCIGKNAIADITNENGETKHYTGSSNTVVLDNVEFTFNSKTVNTDGYDNKASISGKTDVSALKEVITNFVNDYNTMITDLNTKLREKKTSGYLPLTDEEKSGMSESEIKLWEDQVKTGIFRNDTDLSRIANDMKKAMETMMSDTGLKLEDIGIKPVNDFGNKNGTFQIDDAALTDALENNLDNVKQLFTSEEKTTTLSNGSTYVSGGIISTLGSSFKTEFVFSSKSALIKKAGTKNNSISSTIAKELDDRQKVIDTMNEKLTTRENNLYIKYSKLETALSNLYSQQNWLTQQFSN